MKLLIFAHTPPPHHGQSYMVWLMLNGFGGDQRHSGAGNSAAQSAYGISCYHINARVSKELEDIGDFQASKLILLFWYCAQAIWCHFRYGIDTLYYIPAPGKRSALYRDWLVMFLCRPFYKRIILHWHAAGLAKWLETNVSGATRGFTFQRMRDADLSIVLSRYNRADAEKLFPRQIRVVSNGIPDPCPAFDREILPRRAARCAVRRLLASGGTPDQAHLAAAGDGPRLFKVLYLAHCTRDKGLFDTLKAVEIANQKLAESRSPLSIQLTVGGSFVTDGEEREFKAIAGTELGRRTIVYRGFLSGPEKEQALREADFFCFPTFYQNENQPVNLIEAMAYGLPILTTRWRSIPELLPPGYRYLVDIRSPEQVAAALVEAVTANNAETFREVFLQRFNLRQYLAALADAFKSVESAGDATAPMPLRATPADHAAVGGS